MAKIKQLTLDQLYEQVNGLTSKEQKDLKEFLEKTLATKAEALAQELYEINGNKVQSN